VFISEKFSLGLHFKEKSKKDTSKTVFYTWGGGIENKDNAYNLKFSIISLRFHVAHIIVLGLIITSWRYGNLIMSRSDEAGRYFAIENATYLDPNLPFDLFKKWKFTSESDSG